MKKISSMLAVILAWILLLVSCTSNFPTMPVATDEFATETASATSSVATSAHNTLAPVPPDETESSQESQASTGPVTASSLGQPIFWEWPQDGWSLAHANPRVEFASVVRFQPFRSDILAVGSPGGDLALLRLDTSGGPPIAVDVIDSAHNGRIIDILFSATGDYIVTTSTDYTLAVRLVDSTGLSADPLRSIIMPDIATSLALSRPAGSRIAVGMRDGSISLRLLSNQYLSQVVRFAGINSFLWDLDFSLDGTTLYVAGASNYVQLWKISEANRDPILEQELETTGGAVVSVAASPSSPGLFISSSIDGVISAWQDGISQEQYTSTLGEAWALAFSNDGSLLAAGTLDCFLLILDASDLTLLDSQYLCGGLSSTFSKRIQNLQFSANDTYIAVGYARGVIVMPVIQER